MAGLAVLALPILLVALDLFVMLLAVPHLSAALGASSTQQLWILDIYGFMAAGLRLTMGTLGDRIGRRRLLLAGAATFGTASILPPQVDSPSCWMQDLRHHGRLLADRPGGDRGRGQAPPGCGWSTARCPPPAW